MMERDDLTVVYTTNDATEAQIVSNALHAEGIACEVDGAGQAGLTGIRTLVVKLLVRAEDYDKARHFINQHHATREELD